MSKTLLSKAGEYMLGGIAEFERSNRLLPWNCVDYRVYPKLSRLGLVAANIYRQEGGVCFTPKGRELWTDMHGPIERKSE